MREFTNRNMNCSFQGCIQYHRSFISRRQNNTSTMLHSWLAVAGAFGELSYHAQSLLFPCEKSHSLEFDRQNLMFFFMFASLIEWSCTLFTNLGFPTPMIAMFDSFQLIHGYSLRHSLQARRCVSTFAGPNSPIGGYMVEWNFYDRAILSSMRVASLTVQPSVLESRFIIQKLVMIFTEYLQCLQDRSR